MTDNAGPLYHGMLGLDIEGFASLERTDPERDRLRGLLKDLVDEALTQAGIPLEQIVHCADTGDGLMLLADPTVSVRQLLHPTATALADKVAARGSFRLRMIVHGGMVHTGEHGPTGDEWICAFRLLDADTGRWVLDDNPEAATVLMVSDEIYKPIVRHRYPEIDPEQWQPARARVKRTGSQSTQTRVWVHLPGLNERPRLRPRLVVPLELGSPPEDFTGRDDDLAFLRQRLGWHPGETGTSRSPDDGSPAWPVITVIHGMGGIGKSALARQAASLLTDDYPDGQLYLDLHGTTAGLEPLDPLEALQRLLRALGVEQAGIPSELPAATAMLRSLTGGRRLLLVLDNVQRLEQVRPLLPASSTCGVLITSRQALAALEGSHSLRLDLLSTEQARRLLGRVPARFDTRARVDAEPDAAEDVVRWCGGLPLALRIVGVRLAHRPAWSMRDLADWLAKETRGLRLPELDAGDQGLSDTFNVSLSPLGSPTVTAFHLVSLPDGPDMSLAAAAAALNRPQDAAERLLERLVDAQLLESPAPGRYRFHDLLRLFSRQQAVRRSRARQRMEALARVFDFYASTASHALTLLYPGDLLTTGHDPEGTGAGMRHADAEAARDWVNAERPNLLAVASQAATEPTVPSGLARRLATTVFELLLVIGRPRDGDQAGMDALELVSRLENRAMEATVLDDVGVFQRKLGRYAGATASHEESLRLFRENDDRPGQAHSLAGLGATHLGLGLYDEAQSSYQESLQIYQQLGDRHGQAHSIHGLGIADERLGRYDEALDRQRTSLGTYKDLDDRHGEAISLGSLGVVCGCLGLYEEARTCLQDSLRIHQELDDRHGQCEALRDLGDVLRGTGDEQGAKHAWEQALRIARELRIQEAEKLQARLDPALR